MPFFRNSKMALFNPFMWFDLFGPIWSAMIVSLCDFIQNMSQAPSKCLSKWIKMDKWDYLKKPSEELKKPWASYESLEGLECWIGSWYFFGHLKFCADSLCVFGWGRSRSYPWFMYIHTNAKGRKPADFSEE